MGSVLPFYGLARVRVTQDIVTPCEKALYGFGPAFLRLLSYVKNLNGRSA